MGKFSLGVELHRGGSAPNQATPLSFKSYCIGNKYAAIPLTNYNFATLLAGGLVMTATTLQPDKVSFLPFSKHRPSRPMLSISRNVHMARFCMTVKWPNPLLRLWQITVTFLA